MIPTLPFGNTGHNSTRILFGAAALGGMRQEKADQVLATVMAAGINHIDVAASYGDAELRLKPFLADHRGDVFLATKTGDRDADGARRSIETSLTRMGVAQLDLLQFHNLALAADQETVMAPGGALEAAIKAKEEGLVQFIGVTGHGTRIAAMHLKSLAQYDFASVLLPYNYTLMQDATYAGEFEELHALCAAKQIAIQAIKSIARRRWRDDDPAPRFSWYEPLRDEALITRAVHWVLRREHLFLNTSSDATLLPKMIAAAESFDPATTADLDAQVAQDVARHSVEPLFIRGVGDGVT